MSIELFEHNKTAYEAAVSMLAETGKAAVIHPTGTGKSFIGFKLCEDNPDKTVCWLSPSRYIFKTQIENLRSAGFDVSKNIIFFTYKKLTLLSDEKIDEIQPDILVYDEYHRCGATLWSFAVNKLVEKYPNVPMLGLSATNIRYLDNQRNMADELFDGNIASEMTLGEAIVRGILKPPKYVMSVFSYRDDLERYEKRINRVRSGKMRDTAAEYLEKLRRTLEKADGLDEIFFKHMESKTGKYIIFCSIIDAMNECIDLASEWFARVDKSPRIYSVYSGDPESSRSFEDFVNDSDESHLRLLYCIDALNEVLLYNISIRLGSWVSNIRTYRKCGIHRNYLTEERIAELDKIGMVWDAPNYFFEKNYAVLLEYYHTHGDLDVPADYVWRLGRQTEKKQVEAVR